MAMSNSDQTILIVDDETDLLDITASYLKMEGYSTLTAHSGAEALEFDDEDRSCPDYLRHLHAGMSGFEFFEEVRRYDKFQSIPFIFLSGHGDPVHMQKGKELGSDDYLIKPFDPELFISTIRGKLKRKEQLYHRNLPSV